jgi:uncharacterized membrane protein HdeD (DUF308 family)
MTILDLDSRKWGWWLGIGLVLILTGLILLSAPLTATVISLFVLGFFLIIAGIAEVITAFLEKDSNYFWLHLLIAAFTIVIGFLMLYNPGSTLLAITLLIAAFLLASGLFRIIGALSIRFEGWVWFLISGIVSLILGVIILANWPLSSWLILGIFIGIDFIFAGWYMVMVSLLLKKKPVLVK